MLSAVIQTSGADFAVESKENDLEAFGSVSNYLVAAIGQLLGQAQDDSDSVSQPVEKKEGKEREEKGSVPDASSSNDDRSFAVVAHYCETLTTDKWNDILTSDNSLYELVTGVRGDIPASKKDLLIKAEADFQNRKKHREGPPKVTMAPKGGSQGASINSEGRFSSRNLFITAMGNVWVSAGRWYYQVVLHTSGLMQIGWARKEHQPSPQAGNGVGDDKYSWAYDGHRLKKWNAGSENYTTKRWHPGDIVGCALDLDVPGGEMRFFLNGRDLGVAFTNFEIGAGLTPALSISGNESVTLHFDPSKMQTNAAMRSRMPDGYHPLENDKATVSDLTYIRRASQLQGQIDLMGSTIVIRGDEFYCASMAQKLAAAGVNVTVSPIDSLATMLDPDSDENPNLPSVLPTSIAEAASANSNADSAAGVASFRTLDTIQQSFANGRVISCVASEYVAFCRYVLHLKNNTAWSQSLSDSLQRALLDAPQVLSSSPSSSSPSRASLSLLGSLCVLGGFVEPLRVGGMVRVSTSGSNDTVNTNASNSGLTGTDPVALVLQYSLGAPSAHVVFATDIAGNVGGEEEKRGAHANSSAVYAQKVKSGDLAPSSELQVDLSLFPLSSSLFSSLRQLIESKQVDADSDQSATQRAMDDKWLIPELRWRAVSVLESLLSNPHSAAILQSQQELLSEIGALLLAHAADCPLDFQLEPVATMADALRQRLWDLGNGLGRFMTAIPFRAPEQSSVSSSAPASNSALASSFAAMAGLEMAYGSSSYREEKREAPVQDSKMLKYWDKHVIPYIQNYVRGSFKDYEMENFFAQLRQPLRQNNNAAAVQIAMTLCGGHIPEGCSFPDENKDFSTMFLDEVQVGMLVTVDPHARESEGWISAMEHTINATGRVKALSPIRELVLVQFYDEQAALQQEFWYEVSTLRKPSSTSAVMGVVDRLRDLADIQRRLSSYASSLSKLLARRAVFRLLSRAGPAAQMFLTTQAKSKSLAQVFESLYLVVSEALDLGSLDQLGEISTSNDNEEEKGEVVASSQTPMQSLQRNISQFLASAGGSPSDVCEMVMDHYRSLLETASSFTQTHSSLIDFRLAADAKQEFSLQRIAVPGASALVLLFDKNTRLPSGCALSLFSDENCSQLIKSYASPPVSDFAMEDTNKSALSPVVVPASTCYLHITRPSDVPCAGSIQILPVHSSLGLASWCSSFLLSMGRSWAQEAHQGGVIGLCYDFCALLLSNFNVLSMPPSPVKQALTRAISQWLSCVYFCRSLRYASRGATKTGAAPDSATPALSLAMPALRRQVSAATLQTQISTLAQLKQLQDEMTRLVQTENEVNPSGVFTSYLQQVVDLMVASDGLRPSDERLCRRFEFPLPETEEERKKREEDERKAQEEAEAEPEIWSCAMCTFENPMDASECDVCGSPKPKGGAKKAAGGAGDKKDGGAGSNVSQMFHDMMAVASVLRYLNGEEDPELTHPSPDTEEPKRQNSSISAVRALFEAAWRETMADAQACHERLLVLENVPNGPLPDVRRAIIRSVRAVCEGVRVRAEDIFVGIDPARAAQIKEEEKKMKEEAKTQKNAKTQKPKEEKHIFAWRHNLDENGIMYYLGTQQGTATFTNPADLGTVRVTSSSTDPTSADLSALLARQPCRVMTRSGSSNGWFQFDFQGYHVIPTRYTLRQADGRNDQPRSWKLQGSTDGKNWVQLANIRDHNLNAPNCVYTYSIPSSPQTNQRFTSIRITISNPNNSGVHQLVLGGFELYGKLAKIPAKAAPKASPYFAVVELNSSDAKLRQQLMEKLMGYEMPLRVGPPSPEEEKRVEEQDEQEIAEEEEKGTEKPESKEKEEKESSAEKSDAKEKDEKEKEEPKKPETEAVAEPNQKQDSEQEVEKKVESKPDPSETEKPKADANESDDGLFGFSLFDDDTPASSAPSKASAAAPSDSATAALIASASSRQKKKSASTPKQPKDTRADRPYSPKDDTDPESQAFSSSADSQDKTDHVVLSVLPFIATDLDKDEKALLFLRSRLMHTEETQSTDEKQQDSVPTPTDLFSQAVSEVCARHSSDAVLGRATLSSVFQYGGQLSLEKLQVLSTENTSVAELTKTLVSYAAQSTTHLKQVMQWLLAAGYDAALYFNHATTFEQALASQNRGKWTRTADIALMTLLSQMGEDLGESNMLKVQPTQIRVRQEDLSPFPSLIPAFTLPALRLRFAFLKKFNALFASLLPLIDLRRTDAPESIAGLVREARVFVFTGVKTAFLQQILDLTAEACKPTQVTLNRVELKQKEVLGQTIDFLQDSSFAKSFQQLRHLDPFLLRPVRPHGAEPFMAFEVVIKGEHVVGEGGPYRQFFTDVGRELQDPIFNCPLLIPCPNKASKSGENRDKFILRPSSTSSTMIQMFEFLGLLFGCCLRTGVRLPLDLPAFVWKPLVHQALTRADLESIDKQAAEVLKFIEKCDKETFDSSINESFTTRLSDNSVVELKSDGANIKVTYENRMEYVSLAIAARLSEHRPQVDAVLRGMARIFPIQLLSLLTASDLELLICGKSTIDVELLRRHTQYAEGVRPDAPHIDMLWDILSEFDQATRRMFVRFVWAQERLPADDAEFVRSHTRFLIKPLSSSLSNPDLFLPSAETCFLNLSLPAYSSPEIMRQKLLYAISSVVTMSADEAPDLEGRDGRHSDDY